MHRHNAYIFADGKDMQFWGGAAMQRDAEAPVQNLLYLYIFAVEETLCKISTERAFCKLKCTPYHQGPCGGTHALMSSSFMKARSAAGDLHREVHHAQLVAGPLIRIY